MFSCFWIITKHTWEYLIWFIKEKLFANLEMISYFSTYSSFTFKTFLSTEIPRYNHLRSINYIRAFIDLEFFWYIWKFKRHLWTRYASYKSNTCGISTLLFNATPARQQTSERFLSLYNTCNSSHLHLNIHETCSIIMFCYFYQRKLAHLSFSGSFFKRLCTVWSSRD